MLSIRRRDDRAERLRSAGMAFGLGLDDPGLDEPPTTVEGHVCAHCGTPGRLDMIDMPDVRAYFTCPACDRTWDTDRVAARAR